MPVAPEVNSFKRKVRRDQHFLSRSQAQHGAVISNSAKDCLARVVLTAAGGGFRHAAYQGNQFFFR
jgi:hypothetical protein